MLRHTTVRSAPSRVLAICCMALINVVTAIDGARAEVVIYADPLAGSSSAALNGLAPTTDTGGYGGSTGATWNSLNFQANGYVSVDNLHYANALLPFTPQTGEIYKLSADLNATGGDTAWLSIGFATGGRTVTSAPYDFASAWMLLRNTRGNYAGGGYDYLGLSTNGYGNFDEPGGVVNYTVELDTTIANSWVASFFMDGTLLRTAVVGTPSINYVTLGGITSVSGTINNFSLSTLTETPVGVPEPTSIMLVVSSVLGLGLLRRRKMRQGRFIE